MGGLCSLCIVYCIYVSLFFTFYDLAEGCLCSIEAVARICVTGFLFDPEVSIFTLFSPPHPSEVYTPTPAPTPGMARQTSLARGRTITQRLRRLHSNLIRPFALSAPPPSASYPMTATGISTGTNNHNHRDGGLTSRIVDSAHRAHAFIRDPPEPTMLSMAMRSDDRSSHPDSIALPFRLSIGHLHDKTHRNVPYLRQSWSRIDFVAIVSFWIGFLLAMLGVERGEHHIGVFRAMSVIRTARLLTITSGTTVS